MVKTFGHCGCCIREQEDNIKRQRHGVEYLKYVDGLPEGEERDRLIDRAYERARFNMFSRRFNLKRHGTTNQGKYRRRGI